MGAVLTRRHLFAGLAGALALPVRGDDAAQTALVRELRAGGALLMRHAQTTPGVGDPPGWRLDQCSSQRNLDERGIAQAQRLGRWFAAQPLAVTTVRNSPWCRARDTARLAFGRHEDWSALSNIFEDRRDADRQAVEFRRFLQAMRPGELAVLVSHGSTIGHLVGSDGAGLATGESVAVRAGRRPDAPLQVLGRLVVP
jgi:phosphohistidine phosphatase SixA